MCVLEIVKNKKKNYEKKDPAKCLNRKKKGDQHELNTTFVLCGKQYSIVKRENELKNMQI